MENNNQSQIGILTWIGSKVYIRDWIISQFPKHDIYVEVFGGSAAVLFGKERSRVEIYNDLNSEVVNFFRCLQNNSSEMVARLENTPYSREIFNELNTTDQVVLDPIERACNFFFLNRSKINGMGGFSTSLTAHTPEAQTYSNRIDHLREFAKRFRGVIIDHLDFEQVLERYDSKDTLFYLDPPYILESHNRYYGGRFTEADHRRLAKNLFEISGKAVVSYYPHPLVTELYPKSKNCFWITKTVQKHSSNKAETPAEELLIFLNHHGEERLEFS